MTAAIAYEYKCPHCEETYLVAEDIILDGCCGGAFDIAGEVQLPEVRLESCDDPPYDIDLADAQIETDHARVFGVR